MVGNQSSQKKGIVVVPQEVLQTIDRNRDTLSRAEFIETCLDALLEAEEAPARVGKKSESGAGVERGEAAEAISRDEFEKFRKGISNLQRAFIELILAFTIEPVAKASKEEQERLVQRARELLEEQ